MYIHILLSLFIGGCVDCKRRVIQFVTADSDTLYSLSQRGRTQKHCFAGPVVRVSLEHNTRRRENKALLNLTLEEEIMLWSSGIQVTAVIAWLSQALGSLKGVSRLEEGMEHFKY